MLVGIDHVVLACADPDATADVLERRLGLAATAGGRHDVLGTFNRLIWLGDTYLELVGVFDVELASRSWLGRPVIAALDAGEGGSQPGRSPSTISTRRSVGPQRTPGCSARKMASAGARMVESSGGASPARMS